MLGLNQANIPSLNSSLLNAAIPLKQPIGLTQIKDLVMPASFTDDSGVCWKLAKSSKDSSVEIPDPSMVSLTRWWNRVHPASNGKVFIYVVEGIKRPRIESENSVMVLYQWFSTCNRPNFTPNDITAAEWYNANVYTASIVDSRMSQLKALCRINEEQKPAQPAPAETIQELDPKLIGGQDDRGTKQETRKADGTYKK